MNKHTFGIRNKLISIFVVIKILPLVVMAWFSWDEITSLVEVVKTHFQEASQASQKVTGTVTQLATESSIRALDQKSREAIERLTTDTASAVAQFLYERDQDIDLAAQLPPSREMFAKFLDARHKKVIYHHEMRMDVEGERWVLDDLTVEGPIVQSKNADNAKEFHSRPPRNEGVVVEKPLYLEMTFLDTRGREQIKVTTSDLVPSELLDVSKRENTFCKAETYFADLQKLEPDQIYVSEVIGAYQKTHMIGTYSRKRAAELGVTFDPENSAYAGKENPVGKRFQGIIRWAKPVVKDGAVAGYVTLALDHTHVMEFTDHIMPTPERFTVVSDGGSGNYAFIWDYKSRNISHARDYFIVGYDPETGNVVEPWLDEGVYEKWRQSGEPIEQYLQKLEPFREQALSKQPSYQQQLQGTVGLDCRYLNFAPQCQGWNTLTEFGGSGSFLIFWSGLWKLTTAAAIPYYTGRYGHSPQGFGFVTIGANVDEFHKSAMVTAERIADLEQTYVENLTAQNEENLNFLKTTLHNTTWDLTAYTLAMAVLVIIIAIWMASVMTRRITQIIRGMNRFQQGDMQHRLDVESSDEMGDLAENFNQMADDIQKALTAMEQAKNATEEANKQLVAEVKVRKRAEEELAAHRDNLEEMVAKRTNELESEMKERRQVEEDKLQLEHRLRQAEKMEAIGTLAGGVAHDLNNILSGIMTYPDLLLLGLEKSDPRYEPLRTIKRSGEKAAAIVQDLLTMARRGVRVANEVDLNEVVLQYLESPEYSKMYYEQTGLQVDLQLAEDAMPTLGSEVHISKTVMNLVVNAVESMPNGGTLTIITENRFLDTPLELYEKVKAGEYVTLTVKDTGVGIKREDMDRMFEPFFTTKKMGGRSGTGLGMAVVWGAVRDHNGYIDCQSTVGKGTTFTIYFPIFRNGKGLKKADADFSTLMGHGERLLLVDDMEEQLEIGSRILSQLGYEVATATSGEEAIKYLEGKRVDLVILDMIMDPGMDGLETHKAIRLKYPDQRVIIASGFSEDDRIAEALQAGVLLYLKKPYSVAKFGESVQAALMGLYQE
ncbi:response regulator [Desulfogranum japonicum]|uniref:response regulator n=1 Tax=Desulfogranum japonicum TaxID=231447 RepID=UPI0004109600|nr:response regulator [Desulfogranum japonicum]